MTGEDKQRLRVSPVNSVRIMAISRALVIAQCIGLFLTVAACGFKGPVRPLLQPLPAGPETLSVRQIGHEMLLAWNLPQKNQDGSDLSDLAGFDVLRMGFDPATACPECRDTSVLIAQIDLLYLKNARREGNRIYYIDSGVEPDSGYRYRIVPFTANHQEGAAGLLSTVMVTPPPTPEGVFAKAHDRLVRLVWNASLAQDPQQVLLGYNVYRRSGRQEFSRQPINRELLNEPGFEDFQVTNGTTYGYQVTSVVRTQGGQVESAPSPVTESTPETGR